MSAREMIVRGIFVFCFMCESLEEFGIIRTTTRERRSEAAHGLVGCRAGARYIVPLRRQADRYLLRSSIMYSLPSLEFMRESFSTALRLSEASFSDLAMA